MNIFNIELNNDDNNDKSMIININIGVDINGTYRLAGACSLQSGMATQYQMSKAKEKGQENEVPKRSIIVSEFGNGIHWKSVVDQRHDEFGIVKMLVNVPKEPNQDFQEYVGHSLF